MNVCIIGCGNMGSALARRLARFHTLKLVDHSSEKAASLALECEGEACSIEKGVLESDVILLAIKPKDFDAFSKSENLHGKKVISILAGIKMETLKKSFPKAVISRVMPNLAVSVGRGVLGVVAMKEEESFLSTFLEPLGTVVFIPEEKMDALTALTGSGPAFFYRIVETIIEAGKEMGFTEKEAISLTYPMIEGSLALLEKTGKTPSELIHEIASPKGTTEAGLNFFKENQVEASLRGVFLAAKRRSEELH